MQKEITIKVKFEIGQIVYLATDTEQRPAMVIEYVVSEKEILYTISKDGLTINAYDYQLREERDILLATGAHKSN
jgi:hypothetical protein